MMTSLRDFRKAALPLFGLSFFFLSGCRPEDPVQKTFTNEPLGTETQVQSGRVARDWPTLFGPYGNSEIPRDVDFLRLKDELSREKWRIAIGTGYSSPVISAGQVTVTMRIADEEVVRSYDLDQGQVKWEARWPTSFECPYDYSNGPASTPLLVDGRLYVLGAEGAMRCFDILTGELVWGRHLINEGDFSVGPFGLGSSPQIAGEHVIFQVGQADQHGCLMAINRSTGETVWTAVEAAASCSTPVIFERNGKVMLIALTDRGLVSLDARDGEILGEYPFRSRIPLQINATTPVRQHSKLWVSAYGLGTTALEITSDGALAKLWSHKRSLDSQYNNLLMRPEGLIGFSARGHDLTCVDPINGTILWQLACPSGRGNSITAGNQLLVLGETGIISVVLLEADSARVLYSSSASVLRGRCFSMPAYSQDTLVLRSDQELVGLHLPTRSNDKRVSE